MNDNKLIAEFMEWEYLDDIEKYVSPISICIYDLDPWESSDEDWTCAITPKQMLFHSSWDWLMPVLEKILNICAEADDLEKYAVIMDKAPFIGQTYEAVVEFIKCYNKR